VPKDRRKASDNYRKPPAEHQFKKGVSGNPKGRPKKKVVQPGGNALGGGTFDRMSAMVLAEANRLIPVPEGDKVCEIPAMQALLRTMYVAAAKGDTRAAAKLLDVIGRAESARAILAQEAVDYAVEYKKKQLPTVEKHEREGLDPPDIYPHPDDFLINEITGEFIIDGPTSKEQAGARKAFREIALRATPRYFELKGALAKDPKNRALRKEFKEQKYMDFLQKDSDRNMRHTALQQARAALEPKPAEPEDDQPDNPDGKG
jgi:hypothetical protein